MRLDFAAATAPGLRRRENNDRYLANGTVFAVADGVGVDSGGGFAASLAVAALAQHDGFASLWELAASVGSANAAIIEAVRDDPRLSGMATTLCVLAELEAGDADSNDADLNPAEFRLGVCNVGDSRLYTFAGGRLSRLTQDHTIAANLQRDGLITSQEAADHVDRHTLTRSVGLESDVYVDTWDLAASADTRILLCTDGLTNAVSDDGIGALLEPPRAAAHAADALFAAAVGPGHGGDNVTAVVVDLFDDTASEAASDTDGNEKSTGVLGAAQVEILGFRCVAVA